MTRFTAVFLKQLTACKFVCRLVNQNQKFATMLPYCIRFVDQNKELLVIFKFEHFLTYLREICTKKIKNNKKIGMFNSNYYLGFH